MRKLKNTWLASGKRVFLLNDEKDTQRLKQIIESENSNAFLVTDVPADSYPCIAVAADMSLGRGRDVHCHYAIIRIDEIDKLRLCE